MASTGSFPPRWAAAQSRTAWVTARMPGLDVTASLRVAMMRSGPLFGSVVKKYASESRSPGPAG